MKSASRWLAEFAPLGAAKAALRRALAGPKRALAALGAALAGPKRALAALGSRLRAVPTPYYQGAFIGAGVAAVALLVVIDFAPGPAQQQTTVSPVAAPRTPQAGSPAAASGQTGQRLPSHTPGPTAPGAVPTNTWTLPPGPSAGPYPAQQSFGQVAPSSPVIPTRPVSQSPSPVRSVPTSAPPSPTSSPTPTPTPTSSSPTPTPTPTPTSTPTPTPSPTTSLPSP